MAAVAAGGRDEEQDLLLGSAEEGEEAADGAAEEGAGPEEAELPEGAKEVEDQDRMDQSDAEVSSDDGLASGLEDTMLRVAGLGRQLEGALVEFRGCRLLFGCPAGAAGELQRLGLGAADVHAVLLPCGRAADGLPELLRRPQEGAPKTDLPRVLATAPVRLAAEGRLADLAAEARAAEAAGRQLPPGAGNPVTQQEALTALAAAEEVSFGELLSIEGPAGPVTVSAASSGHSLGGCYWMLEALGVRVAALGPCSFASGLVGSALNPEPLRGADALVVVRRGEEALMQTVEAVAQEAAAAVQEGSAVLVPMDEDCALAVDLGEALGRSLAALPRGDQAPVVAVGGPAAYLRKCGAFAEWARPERLRAAHGGRTPFLLDDLRATGRLLLQDSPHDVAAAVDLASPFVALVPKAAWPSEELGCGHVPAQCHALLHGAGAGEGAGPAPAPRVVLEAATGSDADAAQEPAPKRARRGEASSAADLSRLAAVAGGLEAVVAAPGSWSVDGASDAGAPCRTRTLRRTRLRPVPLDLHRPRLAFWMQVAELQKAAARLAPLGADEDTSACAFDGTVVGATRPRLSTAGGPPTAGQPAPARQGALEPQALVAELGRQGHADAKLVRPRAYGGVAPRSGLRVDVPSLKAKVWLGAATGREGGPAETLVEAPTSAARRLLAGVVEGLLRAL